MDAKKKEKLLELCDCMDLRLEVSGAHLDLNRVTVPRTNVTKLRKELSLLRFSIETEKITRP